MAERVTCLRSLALVFSNDFVIVFLSCLLITLIHFLKGHKSLGSLLKGVLKQLIRNVKVRQCILTTTPGIVPGDSSDVIPCYNCPPKPTASD